MYEIWIYENGRAWDSVIVRASRWKADIAMSDLIDSLYEMNERKDMERFEVRMISKEDGEIKRSIRLISA